MDNKRKLVAFDSLVLSHSTIVQMQQELGTSVLLGKSLSKKDCTKQSFAKQLLLIWLDPTPNDFQSFRMFSMFPK